METEYEIARMRAENAALDSGAMKKPEIVHARQVGVLILRSLGLSPERVWTLTRPMRRMGNGGAR